MHPEKFKKIVDERKTGSGNGKRQSDNIWFSVYQRESDNAWMLGYCQDVRETNNVTEYKDAWNQFH